MPPRTDVSETAPLRVAVLGIGWWSDVLADAAKRSGMVEIAACFTRSDEKRAAFAAKYGCRAAASYEEILADPSIAAIINTTPNGVHLETTRMAAAAGKHVFLDKPIANTVAEGREIARICEAAGVVLALGYQRRRESHFRWIKAEIDAGRFGRLVQAECNISRDRLGKIDLSSWRYQAVGMPGRRHAPDRHSLCRRARDAARPGEAGVGHAGAARAARRQPRCGEPHARA